MVKKIIKIKLIKPVYMLGQANKIIKVNRGYGLYLIKKERAIFENEDFDFNIENSFSKESKEYSEYILNKLENNTISVFQKVFQEKILVESIKSFKVKKIIKNQLNILKFPFNFDLIMKPKEIYHTGLYNLKIFCPENNRLINFNFLVKEL